MHDQYITHRIFRNINKKIEVLLGLYVIAGKTIFTTTDITESITIESEFRGIKYNVIINHQSKNFFSGKELEKAKNEDHHVIHTLINVILKQAFRETNLRQIGNQPRFFDVNKAIEVEGGGLKACPGFRASAYKYTTGLTIVIDNINKFMSNNSCLSRINEIMDSPQFRDIKEKQARILYEFQYKTVIANYGYKKTYFVQDIDFTKTPVTFRFISSDGTKMSIAEYFLKMYDLKVTDLKQPLLVVKMNGKECHIPPEFCTVDGVPQFIRDDPRKMRDILQSTRKTPYEKFKAIQDFSGDLFSQNALKNWGFEIEQEPLEITTSVMPTPKIKHPNGSTEYAESNVLRNLRIPVPSQGLKYQRWAICYQYRDTNSANDLLRDYISASQRIGIEIQEPVWIELDNMHNIQSFEQQLSALCESGKTPTIVLIMLSNENLYSSFKAVCYDHNVLSQCVQYKNFKKVNMSVATNILKQMQCKLGADLYNIDLPQGLNPNTMLIGIDVCHESQRSIVGFCASINKKLSQYYSEKILQNKGQEIVTAQLKGSIKAALEAFAQNHNQYPDHFIIFRDGVGDAMRAQVLNHEVDQLKKAIEETYNTAAKNPHITVIIVNKRITQRFFGQDEEGNLLNPPSGCLVNKDVVEKSESNKEFDFYLVPAGANQGCVQPTHFYVALNESPMTRETIEKLTYDLCYYYFNWSGSIKVPAPCQYAHKIAEYIMNLRKVGQSIVFDIEIAKTFHFL